MYIDTTQAGLFKDRFGENLTESGNNNQIRRKLLELLNELGRPDTFRLKNGKLMRFGKYLDRRLRQMFSPPLRPVRLCHYAHNGITMPKKDFPLKSAGYWAVWLAPFPKSTG